MSFFTNIYPIDVKPIGSVFSQPIFIVIFLFGLIGFF